jgi:hypothetical protein
MEKVLANELSSQGLFTGLEVPMGDEPRAHPYNYFLIQIDKTINAIL